MGLRYFDYCATWIDMISIIHSLVPYGFDGKMVEVEGDINRGLPAFNIVGMANKTVNEAKERVRSAVLNSGFSFPDRKVTINLAPAELPKDGTYLDLAIALSVLLLSSQIIRKDVMGKVFVGELSLNGNIKPVRGIISVIGAAKEAGFKEIYIPIKNLPQAALISGITVYGVANLKELFLFLKGQIQLPIATLKKTNVKTGIVNSCSSPTLDYIHGQEIAKRALTIAIAGHHNILLSGPPGTGKTLLARAATNLLPELSEEEVIEVTKLYSIAGLITDDIISMRPFRNPHHTASAISMIGGMMGPGEISLAHRGVLFLDEILEFPRSTLESLRQPLEDRSITISRANYKVTYPADFMLIGTMNPCPCGYLGDQKYECKCTEHQIQNYRKKLSGPLLDRIDMTIEVNRVNSEDLLNNTSNDSNEHIVVKNTITEAISRQKARYNKNGVYNGSLSSYKVTNFIKMSHEAKRLLVNASKSLNLSARSYFKTIKIARTIADLEQSEEIEQKHLAEALTYRQR